MSSVSSKRIRFRRRSCSKTVLNKYLRFVESAGERSGVPEPPLTNLPVLGTGRTDIGLMNSYSHGPNREGRQLSVILLIDIAAAMALRAGVNTIAIADGAIPASAAAEFALHLALTIAFRARHPDTIPAVAFWPEQKV